MAENKIKLTTKLETFQDVQKCFQNIEKVVNKLSDAVNKPAEKKKDETEGKSGDIKTTQEGTTAGSDYTLQVKSEKGWDSPVLKPHYDSGWVAVETDKDYTFKHHLGSKVLVLQWYLKDTSDRVFWIGADTYGNTLGGDYESGLSVYMMSNNAINVGTGNDTIFTHDNTILGHSVGSQKITSGHLRLFAWKTGTRI